MATIRLLRPKPTSYVRYLDQFNINISAPSSYSSLLKTVRRVRDAI
jgi:hypothetical protein